MSTIRRSEVSGFVSEFAQKMELEKISNSINSIGELVKSSSTNRYFPSRFAKIEVAYSELCLVQEDIGRWLDTWSMEIVEPND